MLKLIETIPYLSQIILKHIFLLKQNDELFIYELIIYFITLTLLVIVFTFADWSGRFFLPVLPFIYLFSSAGFFYIFDKFYLKNVKN